MVSPYSPRERVGRRSALLAVLVLLGTVGVGAAGAMAGEDGAVVALRTLKGKEIRVSREGDRIQLPGVQAKAVLINFWATWCDPCREEVPGLVRLFEKYRAKGLVVVGISFDTSQDKLANFVREFRVPYPIWIGNKTLVRKWVVRGVPSSYLVDGGGKIRKRYLGVRTESAFEKDFRSLLSPAERDMEGAK